MWNNGPKAHFPSICILGGGFSGICAGIRLKTKLGVDNFTLFDQNHEFGGTWLLHTFPKCASDVPTHLYSFSFEQNPYWSRTNCSQSEILAYLKRVATKHDLYSNAKFHHQVIKLTWHPKTKKWIVVTIQTETKLISEWVFDIVIAGPGPFRVPNISEIFKNFKGPIIHPAEWDHSIDLKDKVVAVIGSGSSAIQVVPGIVNVVKKLYSFQRRPSYIHMKGGMNISPKIQSLFATFPIAQKAWRSFIFLILESSYLCLKEGSILQSLGSKLCKFNLRRLIPNNPELREKLTPNYPYGCQHPCVSNSFYRALNRGHVEVVREEVKSLEDFAIVTEDGVKREIDVIICATGYKQVAETMLYPARIYVQNESGGEEKEITNFARKDAQFYLGVMSAPFPNMFVILGPNSGAAYNTLVFSIECQTNWIIQVIQRMIRDGVDVVIVKDSVQFEYNKKLQDDIKGLAFGGRSSCNSWFVDRKTGINNVALASSLIGFWRNTRRVRWEDLEFY